MNSIQVPEKREREREMRMIRKWGNGWCLGAFNYYFGEGMVIGMCACWLLQTAWSQMRRMGTVGLGLLGLGNGFRLMRIIWCPLDLARVRACMGVWGSLGLTRFDDCSHRGIDTFTEPFASIIISPLFFFTYLIQINHVNICTSFCF